VTVPKYVQLMHECMASVFSKATINPA